MRKIYQKTLLIIKSLAKRRFGGFTLIELLVVVLIIGILAAIAFPSYQKAVLRSRITSALVDLPALQQAQELYYMANGKYSVHFDELDWSPRTQCESRFEYDTYEICYRTITTGFQIRADWVRSWVYPGSGTLEQKQIEALYCYRGLQNAPGQRYFQQHVGATVCYAAVANKVGDAVLASMGTFVEYTNDCVCNGCVSGRGGCNGYRI